MLTKEKLRAMRNEMNARYSYLCDAMEERELKNSKEGAGGRSHWVNKDLMAATVADELHLKLAVDDFKTILAQIRRLK